MKVGLGEVAVAAVAGTGEHEPSNRGTYAASSAIRKNARSDGFSRFDFSARAIYLTEERSQPFLREA